MVSDTSLSLSKFSSDVTESPSNWKSANKFDDCAERLARLIKATENYKIEDRQLDNFYEGIEIYEDQNIVNSILGEKYSNDLNNYSFKGCVKSIDKKIGSNITGHIENHKKTDLDFQYDSPRCKKIFFSPLNSSGEKESEYKLYYDKIKESMFNKIDDNIFVYSPKFDTQDSVKPSLCDNSIERSHNKLNGKNNAINIASYPPVIAQDLRFPKCSNHQIQLNINICDSMYELSDDYYISNSQTTKKTDFLLSSEQPSTKVYSKNTEEVSKNVSMGILNSPSYSEFPSQSKLDLSQVHIMNSVLNKPDMNSMENITLPDKYEFNNILDYIKECSDLNSDEYNDIIDLIGDYTDSKANFKEVDYNQYEENTKNLNYKKVKFDSEKCDIINTYIMSEEEASSKFSIGDVAVSNVPESSLEQKYIKPEIKKEIANELPISITCNRKTSCEDQSLNSWSQKNELSNKINNNIDSRYNHRNMVNENELDNKIHNIDSRYNHRNMVNENELDNKIHNIDSRYNHRNIVDENIIITEKRKKNHNNFNKNELYYDQKTNNHVKEILHQGRSVDLREDSSYILSQARENISLYQNEKFIEPEKLDYIKEKNYSERSDLVNNEIVHNHSQTYADLKPSLQTNHNEENLLYKISSYREFSSQNEADDYSTCDNEFYIGIDDFCAKNSEKWREDKTTLNNRDGEIKSISYKEKSISSKECNQINENARNSNSINYIERKICPLDCFDYHPELNIKNTIVQDFTIEELFLPTRVDNTNCQTNNIDIQSSNYGSMNKKTANNGQIEEKTSSDLYDEVTLLLLDTARNKNCDEHLSSNRALPKPSKFSVNHFKTVAEMLTSRSNNNCSSNSRTHLLGPILDQYRNDICTSTSNSLPRFEEFCLQNGVNLVNYINSLETSDKSVDIEVVKLTAGYMELLRNIVSKKLLNKHETINITENNYYNETASDPSITKGKKISNIRKLELPSKSETFISNKSGSGNLRIKNIDKYNFNCNNKKYFKKKNYVSEDNIQINNSQPKRYSLLYADALLRREKQKKVEEDTLLRLKYMSMGKPLPPKYF